MLGLLIAFIVAEHTPSDGCDAVLRHAGREKIEYSRSALSTVEEYRKTCSSLQTAANNGTAANVSVPVEGVPVKFDFSSTKSKSAHQMLCSSEDVASLDAEMVSLFMDTAYAPAVEAWSKCKQLADENVILEAVQLSESNVQARIINRRRGAPTNSAMTIAKITAAGMTCSGVAEGQSIASGDSVLVQCERRGSDLQKRCAGSPPMAVRRYGPAVATISIPEARELLTVALPPIEPVLTCPCPVRSITIESNFIDRPQKEVKSTGELTLNVTVRATQLPPDLKVFAKYHQRMSGHWASGEKSEWTSHDFRRVDDETFVMSWKDSVNLRICGPKNYSEECALSSEAVYKASACTSSDWDRPIFATPRHEPCLDQRKARCSDTLTTD